GTGAPWSVIYRIDIDTRTVRIVAGRAPVAADFNADGVLTTIVGKPAADTALGYVRNVAADSKGNVYYDEDSTNEDGDLLKHSRLLRVRASDGVIEHVAFTEGDPGPLEGVAPIDVGLVGPDGIFVDDADRVLVGSSHAVVRLDFAAGTSRLIAGVTKDQE